MKTGLLAAVAAVSLAASATAAVMAQGAKQEAERTRCALAAMTIPDSRTTAVREVEKYKGNDSYAAEKAAAIKDC